MKPKTSRIPAVAVLFWLFSGCSQLHQELLIDGRFCSVEVVLPETNALYPNETLPGNRRWHILWRDAEGGLRYASTAQSTVLISVERGITVPIRAWFADTDGKQGNGGFSPRCALPDAGSIFPNYARWESGEGSVRMSFIEGIAAETADSSIRNAAGGAGAGCLITSRFNWNRFRDELMKKTYPHLIDVEAAARSILSGKFALRNLREKSHIMSSVLLPKQDQSSRLRMGSLFGEEIETSEAPGNTAMLPLEEGVNFFYSPQGLFAVVRAKDDDIICIYEPYHLPDSPSSDTVDSI